MSQQLKLSRWSRVLWGAVTLLFAAAGLVTGQESPAAANLRAANGVLLRLHGQFQAAAPAQQNAMKSQISTVIRQRAATLNSLIRSNPGAALQLSFSQDLLDTLAADIPEASQYLESHGKWQGTADVFILDAADMKSSVADVHLTTARERLDVVFAGDLPEGLRCNSVLSVEGVRVGTTVAAAGGNVTSTALASSPCSTTGPQNIAVLMVTFPGVAPNISATAVSNLMFGTGNRSLDGYWRDASYGQTSATGNVFGWYTLPTAYTCDQYSSILSAAIAAADADVYFPNYTRVFILFPKPAGCSYGGLGSIGCSTITSSDGTSTASVAWLISDYLSPNDQGVEIASHEGGHNLGLNHSRSRSFGTEPLGALGSTGTLNEYGDNFSTMGYYNLGHYAAQQKSQLGWFSGSNVLTVQSGGSFSIAPMAWNTSAIQALKVQRGTGNNAWLWLEYHQPVGNYESMLSSQIFSGATIRYLDSTTGAYTDLLDFTPTSGSWFDPALAAGATWVDQYTNVSLAIGAATSNGLTVNVAYGALTCTTAAPTVTASPSNPTVAAGGSANYTITITSKDSSACNSRIFSLSTTQPSGWAAALSTNAVTLGPGQSTTVSMTQTPPSNTTPGTYPVAASASDSVQTGTGNANCSVTAPPQPISVTVAVGASTYARRSTVSASANVLSGSAPAAGATVQFVLTKPNGQQTSKSVTTGSNGTAVWNYKLSAKDPVGTYTLNATATYGSQTATSAPVAFQVQ